MVTGGRSRPAPRGPGGGRPRWRRGRAAADGDHRGLRCGQVVFAKTWAPVEEVTLGGRWGESRISLIRKSPPGAERKLHSSPSGGHSPDASPREPVVLLQVMPCASREADKNPHAVLLVGMEPTPSQSSAARSTALPSWPASSWGRTVRPHDDDVFQPSWARIAPAGCSVVCTLT